MGEVVATTNGLAPEGVGDWLQPGTLTPTRTATPIKNCLFIETLPLSLLSGNMEILLGKPVLTISTTYYLHSAYNDKALNSQLAVVSLGRARCPKNRANPETPQSGSQENQQG